MEADGRKSSTVEGRPYMSSVPGRADNGSDESWPPRWQQGDQEGNGDGREVRSLSQTASLFPRGTEKGNHQLGGTRNAGGWRRGGMQIHLERRTFSPCTWHLEIS